MTQRTLPLDSYGVHTMLLCYAGSLESCTFPWSRGGMDIFLRHVGSRSSNSTCLSGHRATYCTSSRVSSNLLIPPPRGGFSLSFCYDHLLNDPQGSSRCGSAGDGMSLLQELIVYGVGITEWWLWREKPSWEGDYGYLIVLARCLA